MTYILLKAPLNSNQPTNQTFIIQECIHRLANPRKGCTSIVISIGHEVGGAIAHRGRSLISTIALC